MNVIDVDNDDIEPKHYYVIDDDTRQSVNDIAQHIRDTTRSQKRKRRRPIEGNAHGYPTEELLLSTADPDTDKHTLLRVTIVEKRSQNCLLVASCDDPNKRFKCQPKNLFHIEHDGTAGQRIHHSSTK